MQTMDFEARFRAARRVSTPIVAIATNDQQATVRTLTEYLTKSSDGKDIATPIIVWNLIQGMGAAGTNGLGEAALRHLADTKGIKPEEIVMPFDCLNHSLALPARSVVILLNAHNYVAGQTEGTKYVSQALLNARDLFKDTARMAILLGPEFTFPAELKPDVYLLDEPLPTPEHLGVRVTKEHESFNNSPAAKKGKVVLPDADGIKRAVAALRGIESMSAASQAIAMCLDSSGLNVDELWLRKRQSVNGTPGLSMHATKETYADLEGYERAKLDFRRWMLGKREFSTIVWIDEMEKAFAGVGTDTSGVSTEMHGLILNEMQEQDYVGGIFLGPPGCGKSAFVKALAGEFNRELIAYSLSEMKGSLVGESTAKMIRAHKIIRAVSGGKALFLATSNGIESIPGELIRRFSLVGTYFFDLPTEAENRKIWALYMRKYGLPEQEIPKSPEWTGAEIRNCCDRAWSMDIPLIESAKSTIPVAVSARERLNQLRGKASGKYNNASAPGAYTWAAGEVPKKKDKAEPGRVVLEDA